MKLTEEDAKRIISLYEDNKIIIMRKPPLSCTCGEKIYTYTWIPDLNTFEKICPKCGSKFYG